jgi:hypothetical protein
MTRLFAVASLVLMLLAGCASTPPETLAGSDRPATHAPTTPPSPTDQPTAAGTPTADPPATTPAPATSEAAAETLLAVGDIASCDATGDEAVAQLVGQQEGVIALLGDVAYPHGTPDNFANCFSPAWGQFRDRMYPSPGNHEYGTPGAAGYFEYFGPRAAGPGGWYSYDLGEHWRVIVLNANCGEVGCGPDSEQGRWLEQTLRDTTGRHILAYWHHARFSTGPHGPDSSVAPFWDQLYQAQADVVLSAHDHIYERFTPQTPWGAPATNGIRQFTVGTGGAGLYDYGSPPSPTTEVRNNDTFGVLELTLGPREYSWRFIPAEGTFTDSGSQPLPPP